MMKTLFATAGLLLALAQAAAFADGPKAVGPKATVLPLANADFSEGLKGWRKLRYSPKRDLSSLGALKEDPPHKAVLAFKRARSGMTGGGLYVAQAFDFDVSSYAAAHLQASVKVLSHSVKGSGWWSDRRGGQGVYPVHLYLQYQDAGGKPHTWSWGFLSGKDPDKKTNYSVVEKGKWHRFTSKNLMDLKPRPKRITAIKVGGDGWDFQGRLDDIRLVARKDAPLAPGVVAETGAARKLVETPDPPPAPVGGPAARKTSDKPPKPDAAPAPDLSGLSARAVADKYLDALKAGRYAEAVAVFHRYPAGMPPEERGQKAREFVEVMKVYEREIGRIVSFKFIGQRDQGASRSRTGTPLPPMRTLTYRAKFEKAETDVMVKLARSDDGPRVMRLGVRHVASVKAMQRLMQLRQERRKADEK